MTNGTPPDTTPEAAPTLPVVSLINSESLLRLRERITKAVGVLDRLRRENAALSDRIRELETRPVVDLDRTVLVFEEDPDELRAKVDAFIATIDGYLAAGTVEQ